MKLPGGTIAALRRYDPWSAVGVENLLVLRDIEKLDWPEIADTLGHTQEECKYRYDIVKESHALQDHIREHGRRPNKSFAPQLLDDREARALAKMNRDYECSMRGDLAPILLGDPEPGRSALDRRKNPA